MHRLRMETALSSCAAKCFIRHELRMWASPREDKRQADRGRKKLLNTRKDHCWQECASVCVLVYAPHRFVFLENCCKDNTWGTPKSLHTCKLNHTHTQLVEVLSCISVKLMILKWNPSIPVFKLISMCMWLSKMYAWIKIHLTIFWSSLIQINNKKKNLTNLLRLFSKKERDGWRGAMGIVQTRKTSHWIKLYSQIHALAHLSEEVSLNTRDIFLSCNSIKLQWIVKILLLPIQYIMIEVTTKDFCIS